jgi:ElaB/YqjD/DUF883 family membrane-anchored ribosome-binding protein
MEEQQNSEEAAESGEDHLRAAGDDLKESVGAKIEDLRHAAEQQAGALRSVAQSKDHDLTESAENVSADVGSKTRNWMTEAEAYVRENPLRAVLIAFAVGLVLAPRK